MNDADALELLKAACREAYQWAWNIEQKATEPLIRQRAVEIKRVTMGALQATNAEYQARKQDGVTGPVPEGEEKEA